MKYKMKKKTNSRYNTKYFSEAFSLFGKEPTPEEIKKAEELHNAIGISNRIQAGDDLARGMTDVGYKGPAVGSSLPKAPEYSTYGKTTNVKDPIFHSFKRGEKISDADYVLGGDLVKKTANAAYKKTMANRTGERLTQQDAGLVSDTDTLGLNADKLMPKPKADSPDIKANGPLNAKLPVNTKIDVNNSDMNPNKQLSFDGKGERAQSIQDSVDKVDVNKAAEVAGKASGSTTVQKIVEKNKSVEVADKAKALGEASGPDGKAVVNAAGELKAQAGSSPAADAKPEDVKEQALGPIESLWVKFKNTSFYKTVEGWINSITEFFGRKIGSSNITYGTATLWVILTAIAAYIIYKIAKWTYRKYKARKAKKLAEAKNTYDYLKYNTNLSESTCRKIARYVYTR